MIYLIYYPNQFVSRTTIDTLIISTFATARTFPISSHIRITFSRTKLLWFVSTCLKERWASRTFYWIPIVLFTRPFIWVWFTFIKYRQFLSKFCCPNTRIRTRTRTKNTIFFMHWIAFWANFHINKPIVDPTIFIDFNVLSKAWP